MPDRNWANLYFLHVFALVLYLSILLAAQKGAQPDGAAPAGGMDINNILQNMDLGAMGDIMKGIMAFPVYSLSRKHETLRSY